MPRRLASSVLLAVILAVGGAGCGDDDGTEPAADTTTTVAEPASTTTAGAPSTTAAAQVTLIEVEVAGGEPVGGVQRPEVAVGEPVTIRVTVDVADEVHVHGYDLLADVGPGSPAEISFTADIPGQFEVELESAGLLILELTVS